MSLDTLNRIVGEAIVNAEFCRALLANPGAAVAGFELGAEEHALITAIRAGSVDQLARQLMVGLNLERSAPAWPAHQPAWVTTLGTPATSRLAPVKKLLPGTLREEPALSLPKGAERPRMRLRLCAAA